MVNKVTLFGNIGREAEAKSTKSGSEVVSFSLATTESYKDKSGAWQKNTTWHNVSMFTYSSDHYVENLKKGTKALVFGKINCNKVGDKTYYNIIADKVIPVNQEEQAEQRKKTHKAEASSYEEEEDIPF